MEILIALTGLLFLALSAAVFRRAHAPRKAHGFVSALGQRGKIPVSEVAGFTPSTRAAAASTGRPAAS